MRDPARIPAVLAVVAGVWKKYPDLHLTQLLTTAAQHADWTDNDLFHLEDHVLVEGLLRLDDKEDGT